MRSLLKRIPVLLSFILLVIAVMIKSEQPSFMVQLQNKVFDVYQRQYPREYEPAGVRIIDIDEESLTRLGQWPWSRQVMAELVYRLITHNAGVIAFDIVFAETDRTSPRSIAELWHAQPELSELLHALPDHDEMLADAFRHGYVVTGFVLTHKETARQPTKKFGFSYAGMEGSKPTDFLLRFGGSTLNLPMYEKAAEGNGFFNNTPDADGIVRRVPLALALDDDVYFSLGMEALRVAQGASSYVIKMAGASGEESYGAESGITHIRSGHLEIPTDANGNFLVHYTEHTDDRYIPAWKVLSDDFDASLVEGHILLFGTSAPGLKDLRATPMKPSLPGVEVHAQAIEQMLLGQFLYRPDWVLYAEIVGLAAVGLLLIVVMSHLPATWGALFMLAAQGGALYFSVEMFRTQGYLIDPVSPGLAILMLYLTESLRRYILSESERKQVRGAFAQYMSPVLVEELAKSPDKLELGGEMKELTILFCDVRGFTSISERFNAEQLTTFINRFLTPMTDVILARKGTIDKYMGDCIMAFWNAPLDDSEHAKNACRSALAMIGQLEQWNARRKQRATDEGWDYFDVDIGIGLNTGEICVGNMGSEQRFDYSVLGDDVNLASRLEGQSKTYGVSIVIGENTRAQASDMATLALDDIKVKGKDRAVRIYTLLGDEGLALHPEFVKLKELWEHTREAYQAMRWDECEHYLGLCATQCANVPDVVLSDLFALYQERLALYRQTPPPDDWDGVFEAKSK